MAFNELKEPSEIFIDWPLFYHLVSRRNFVLIMGGRNRGLLLAASRHACCGGTDV